MRERVYSYLRFSDAKQADGYSTERQTAYAEAWAKEHGLQLDAELSMRDEGLSAYHQTHVKRGALGVFLAAVEIGQVPKGSVLVVEGLDRLSRAEPILAQAQLASIINAGITVVTASDNKVYSRERLKANPMDLVYSLLVMIRAHEESDTKSKRVRDAIRRQCTGWQAGKALMPNAFSSEVKGYLRLDDKNDSPTDKPLRKLIGKAMEQQGIKPTLVANPHKEGELVAVTQSAGGTVVRTSAKSVGLLTA
ncbi:Resolvase, N terminal domain [Paenacidovorax caeni]|uniref:Resolvase, N terminal domain n=1 Tax=Paenacidovorax caeni TaxID=343013 RepID=A0A1I7I5S5_9BURK|nr:Resolvase, N terminal domain [Paenacidovorax caeni]